MSGKLDGRGLTPGEQLLWTINMECASRKSWVKMFPCGGMKRREKRTENGRKRLSVLLSLEYEPESALAPNQKE
jgi:hypothetical protein